MTFIRRRRRSRSNGPMARGWRSRWRVIWKLGRKFPIPSTGGRITSAGRIRSRKTMWSRSTIAARRVKTTTAGAPGCGASCAFDKYGVKASFNTNALCIHRYPEAVKAVHERGHEIVGHSYAEDIQLTQLTEEGERDEI